VDPTPRSLILDLLSTLRGRSAPVRALVRSARLFGIGENRLRVALARLLAEGRLERDERGRYRLGPAIAAVSERIHAWRTAEQSLRPWSGDWVAVHTADLEKGPAARRRARAFRLLGLRPLGSALQMRPDNLAGGVASLRERLRALGLEDSAPVGRLGQLDAASQDRACALWDGPALVRAYRKSLGLLEASAARLPQLSRDAARVESFRIGGSVLRQLALDPMLPEPLVPAGERGALVAAMRSYDRLGRRAWAGWLGEDGDTPARAPAGVRGTGPEADLLRAAEGVQ
jgi:phenylacetic acid degradation operon negative regulatory protein